MPASVLLALLAATALLALTPALVRRYDPDERMIADRASSDARVLDREGHRPTRPTSHDTADLGLEAHSPDQARDGHSLDELLDGQGLPAQSNSRGWERRGTRRGDSVRLEADESYSGEDPEMHEQARLRQMRAEWWRRRHRRILYVLIALTVLELAGVAIAGPGFWIGAGLSAAALGGYVYFLRDRAKRRRPRRRPKAMITAEPEHDEVGPPTYVPEQPDGDEDDEDTVPRESYLFENGTLGDEPSPPPRPDPRRPDGPAGVRGRSYEAPAKLER
ncbi:hypothetical protein [Glycomyces sp. NPDC048151]|uniref:hypothetical protein n=1 Tax=Glycomyces sp. NPDC048151 TaxID=3364002 RepID=UPI0037141A8F